jgi:hypothetical protein
MAVKVGVMVFWVVIACSEVVGYQCYRRPSEDGGSMVN